MTTSAGTYCIVSFCGRTPVNSSSIQGTFKTGDYLVVISNPSNDEIILQSISPNSLTMQQFLTSVGQIINIDSATKKPIIIVRQ